MCNYGLRFSNVEWWEDSNKDVRDLLWCSLEGGGVAFAMVVTRRRFTVLGSNSLLFALPLESVPKQLLTIQGFFIRGMDIKSISSPPQKSMEILFKSLRKYIYVFYKWTHNYRILLNVQHANYSLDPCNNGWCKFYFISKKSIYFTLLQEGSNPHCLFIS